MNVYNKNEYKKITLILFLYKIINRIAFNTFENNTIILEINNIK